MDAITNALVAQGPSGVGIAICLFFIYTLYKRNNDLSDAMQAITKEYAMATAANTAATTRLADLMADRKQGT